MDPVTKREITMEIAFIVAHDRMTAMGAEDLLTDQMAEPTGRVYVRVNARPSPEAGDRWYATVYFPAYMAMDVLSRLKANGWIDFDAHEPTR